MSSDPAVGQRPATGWKKQKDSLHNAAASTDGGGTNSNVHSQQQRQHHNGRHSPARALVPPPKSTIGRVVMESRKRNRACGVVQPLEQARQQQQQRNSRFGIPGATAFEKKTTNDRRPEKRRMTCLQNNHCPKNNNLLKKPPAARQQQNNNKQQQLSQSKSTAPAAVISLLDDTDDSDNDDNADNHKDKVTATVHNNINQKSSSSFLPASIAAARTAETDVADAVASLKRKAATKTFPSSSQPVPEQSNTNETEQDSNNNHPLPATTTTTGSVSTNNDLLFNSKQKLQNTEIATATTTFKDATDTPEGAGTVPSSSHNNDNNQNEMNLSHHQSPTTQHKQHLPLLSSWSTLQPLYEENSSDTESDEEKLKRGKKRQQQEQRKAATNAIVPPSFSNATAATEPVSSEVQPQQEEAGKGETKTENEQQSSNNDNTSYKNDNPRNSNNNDTSHKQQQQDYPDDIILDDEDYKDSSTSTSVPQRQQKRKTAGGDIFSALLTATATSSQQEQLYDANATTDGGELFFDNLFNKKLEKRNLRKPLVTKGGVPQQQQQHRDKMQKQPQQKQEGGGYPQRQQRRQQQDNFCDLSDDDADDADVACPKKYGSPPRSSSQQQQQQRPFQPHPASLSILRNNKPSNHTTNTATAVAKGVSARDPGPVDDDADGEYGPSQQQEWEEHYLLQQQRKKRRKHRPFGSSSNGRTERMTFSPSACGGGVDYDDCEYQEENMGGNQYRDDNDDDDDESTLQLPNEKKKPSSRTDASTTTLMSPPATTDDNNHSAESLGLLLTLATATAGSQDNGEIMATASSDTEHTTPIVAAAEAADENRLSQSSTSTTNTTIANNSSTRSLVERGKAVVGTMIHTVKQQCLKLSKQNNIAAASSLLVKSAASTMNTGAASGRPRGLSCESMAQESQPKITRIRSEPTRIVAGSSLKVNSKTEQPSRCGPTVKDSRFSSISNGQLRRKQGKFGSKPEKNMSVLEGLSYDDDNDDNGEETNNNNRMTMMQKKRNSFDNENSCKTRSKTRRTKAVLETIEIVDDDSDNELERSTSIDEIAVTERSNEGGTYAATERSSQQGTYASTERSSQRGTYDGARIAVGKKVFSSDCHVSIFNRYQCLRISWKNDLSRTVYQSCKTPQTDESFKNFLEISSQDANLLKYYIPLEQEQESSRDDDEDDESQMAFLCLGVEPNERNGLAKYSNSYKADGKDAERYLVIEFRSNEDLKLLLDRMSKLNQWSPFVTDQAKLVPDEVEAHAWSLIEDSKKDQRKRRSSPKKKREGFLAGRKDDETLLVFPFAGDKKDIEKASEGLHEAGADNRLKKSCNYKGGEEKDVKQTQTATVSGSNVQESAGGNKKSRTHTVEIKVIDFERLEPGEFLNDTIIDFWNQWMTRGDDRSDTHFFTSHFFSVLEHEGVPAVTKWTRNKNINVFEKKMVFIPINKNLHWSLCVVVNPGCVKNIAQRNNEKAFPCLLFFDSLKAHKKCKVAKTVRKWLNSEWNRLYDDQFYFTKDTLKPIDPKIPYQDNSWDCGVFVCRYAFALYRMRNEDFSLNDYAENFRSIITESSEFVFDMSDIARFREELKSLIIGLHKVYKPWKEKRELKEMEAMMVMQRTKPLDSKLARKGEATGESSEPIARSGAKSLRTGASNLSSQGISVVEVINPDKPATSKPESSADKSEKDLANPIPRKKGLGQFDDSSAIESHAISNPVEVGEERKRRICAISPAKDCKNITEQLRTDGNDEANVSGTNKPERIESPEKKARLSTDVSGPNADENIDSRSEECQVDRSACAENESEGQTDGLNESEGQTDGLNESEVQMDGNLTMATDASIEEKDEGSNQLTSQSSQAISTTSRSEPSCQEDAELGQQQLEREAINNDLDVRELSQTLNEISILSPVPRSYLENSDPVLSLKSSDEKSPPSASPTRLRRSVAKITRSPCPLDLFPTTDQVVASKPPPTKVHPTVYGVEEGSTEDSENLVSTMETNTVKLEENPETSAAPELPVYETADI